MGLFFSVVSAEMGEPPHQFGFVDFVFTHPAMFAAVCSILVLIALGVWAERRFSGFSKLPLHYGFRGRATREGGRSLAIWLPIGVFVLLAAWVGVLSHGRHEPYELVTASAALVLAQALILWRHSRWARGQG